VQNARRRLIAAINWAGDRYGMTLFNGFVQQVVTHLLGEVGRWREGVGIPNEAPDGIDGRPPYIGPLAQLSLWWTLECEGKGWGAVGVTMPERYMIPTVLLNGLLGHVPTAFTPDLFHDFEAYASRGMALCLHCNETPPDHFTRLMELHIGEIEILRSDMGIMEAVLDIQAQAISKQTEAIEHLREGRMPYEVPVDPANCRHGSWGSSPGEPLHCNHCGTIMDELPYTSAAPVTPVDPADCRHNQMEGGTTCQQCGTDLTKTPDNPDPPIR
jgi:hypothetical protein